jgi:putative tryptophan/tyrosine transport system substrate-binding protein
MVRLGYVKGKDFVIVVRAADGKWDRFAAFAKEMVDRKVDLILAESSNAVSAAQRATATIPIVFVGVSDPVADGFADSLSQPGRNVTGLANLTMELHPKRLQLFMRMQPGLKRLSVLFNPARPMQPAPEKAVQIVAEGFSLRTSLIGASTDEELAAAFKAMSAFGAEAVYVVGDPYHWSRRKQIADMALVGRLASMAASEDFVRAGGLASYGVDEDTLMPLAANYIDRILKGARPADLPIEMPTKLDFTINQTTARRLNLAIPQAVLLQASKTFQ